jgi:hypothetical protein
MLASPQQGRMDLEQYRQRDRTAEAARRRRRQAEGERLRRTHRRRRGLALGVLVVPIAIAAFAFAPGDNKKDEASAPATTAADAATTAAPAEKSEPLRFAEPDVVRGVHVDFVTAGSTDALGNILAAAEPDKGLNALQLDVKDEKGVIGIPVDVPLAKKIGAVQPQYDARKVIKKAHEAGLYTIARIVVFQDPILAAKGGKLALEKKGGGVWETSGGLGWVDPTDRRVWDYVIDVSLAAADAGFDEVMYDYVRFPTDGDIDAAAYARGNASKDKTIEGFLKKASSALHAKGVKVSAAIFAIQATSQAPIGQDPAELKRVLDTISPMVYPSHFASGNFDLPSPVSQPYDTVFASLIDWRRDMVNGKARLRPWLQDFDLGTDYSTAQVQDQIRAANDSGTDGYLLWNPVADYSPGVLVP